jgi:hypothetical protein
MAYPHIIYNSGTGPVTLLFTFPPIQKPNVIEYGTGDERKREGEGVDSITQSGLKQSITFRVDIFRTLNMECASTTSKTGITF